MGGACVRIRVLVVVGLLGHGRSVPTGLRPTPPVGRHFADACEHRRRGTGSDGRPPSALPAPEVLRRPDGRGGRGDRPHPRRPPRGGPRRPRRPRRGVHPARDRASSASSSWAAGRCCSAAAAAPRGCSARRAWRWPRSSTTWRSGTTSCTASGTGCATRRSTRSPGSGTTRRRRSSGSARTTSRTTPTPTSSARTTTSATASCASTRTSRGSRATSCSRCGTSSTRASSSTASRCTTSTSASHLREKRGMTPELKDARSGRPLAKARAAGCQGLRRCTRLLSGRPWRPHPRGQPRPPTWSATCGATR